MSPAYFNNPMIKRFCRRAKISAFFAASLTPVWVAEGMIPDGDFEAADGAAWEQTSGGGTFVYEFPANGGNPGGCGIIDNTSGGGFGILVTDNGRELPLANLGLTAGEAYNFKLDMRIVSGANLGGLKVDFFENGALSGSTGDIFPQVIGTGAAWETYSFQVTIPVGTEGLKLVPLWGAGSSVAYDNLTYDPNPIDVEAITEIPNGDFEGGGASWAQGGGENTTFAFEAADGNPNGYAVMENDGAGFGVLVANGGAIIPIGGLELEAGSAYRFSQDMRLFSGSDLGGLKVEFYRGAVLKSDVSFTQPAPIGDGSEWATYTFQVDIPLEVDGIKLVPLAGIGSRVGYDNFVVGSQAFPSPPILNAGFEDGNANWTEYQVGTTYDYPQTGGNPGRFVEMTNDGSEGSYGVIVANGDSISPKSRFGITGEGNYEFKADLKIFEGSSIGGLKIEFYGEGGADFGNTGDMFPALIGDGSTWETYTFDVFVPADVVGLKVVPLWGPGSRVGIDNIVVPGALQDGYAGWIAGFPDVGEMTGFNDDPDQDGQPNGVENHLGTDPSKASTGLSMGRVNAATGEIIFSHSINLEPVPEAANASYFWSSDMVNFYDSGEAAPDGTSITFDTNPGIPTTGLTRAIRAISTGAQVPTRVFVRLQVSAASR
jgi:hypothetical protein